VKKTKFMPLVELKKRKVEELELKLSRLRQDIVFQKEKIMELKSRFNALQTPKEGVITYFATRQLFHVAFKQELEMLQMKMQELRFEEANVIQALKNENIELEKFKILHQDEVNKRLKAIRKQEDNFMDEIGNIRYARGF